MSISPCRGGNSSLASKNNREFLDELAPVHRKPARKRMYRAIKAGADTPQAAVERIVAQAQADHRETVAIIAAVNDSQDSAAAFASACIRIATGQRERAQSKMAGQPVTARQVKYLARLGTETGQIDNLIDRAEAAALIDTLKRDPERASNA